MWWINFNRKTYINGFTLHSKVNVITIVFSNYNKKKFSRQPIHMLVRAGVTNYKSEEGQTVNVSAIYNHPDFLLKTYENDISILKLKEPLVLGDKVALVEITKTEPKAKEIAFAAGWGSTSTSKFSDELLYVKLPIVDRNECKTLLKPSLFTDDMICAGYMEGIYDTCKVSFCTLLYHLIP